RGSSDLGRVVVGDIIIIKIPARCWVLVGADCVVGARGVALVARGCMPLDRKRLVSFALGAYAMFATRADTG
ncbi:dihydroxy-acid dehydratase, partial [Aeromonas veronii]